MSFFGGWWPSEGREGSELRVAVGVFVCACGHPKASHRPHGGRRVPQSGWVCRKEGCDCEEYGQHGVTIATS